MKQIKALLGTLLLLILISCDNSPRSVIYTNDCDGNDGWINDNTCIDVKSKAHSGRNVSKMDSLNRYGLAFSKRIKDISNKTNFNTVNVQAWIYPEVVMKNCGIIVDLIKINRENKMEHVDFQRHQFQGIKATNEWVKIYHTFSLPSQKIKPEHLLRIYIFSNPGDVLLVDDYRIEIE
jgi:hypothetical protein